MEVTEELYLTNTIIVSLTISSYGKILKENWDFYRFTTENMVVQWATVFFGLVIISDVWTTVNFKSSLTCNILLLSRPGPGGMNREYEQNNHESGMFETTFGVDGEVETYTNEKPVSLSNISDLLIINYHNKQLIIPQAGIG